MAAVAAVIAAAVAATAAAVAVAIAAAVVAVATAAAVVVTAAVAAVVIAARPPALAAVLAMAARCAIGAPISPVLRRQVVLTAVAAEVTRPARRHQGGAPDRPRRERDYEPRKRGFDDDQ